MNSEVGVTFTETMIGSLPGNLDYEMIHYPYNIVDLLFFEASGGASHSVFPHSAVITEF